MATTSTLILDPDLEVQKVWSNFFLSKSAIPDEVRSVLQMFYRPVFTRMKKSLVVTSVVNLVSFWYKVL